MKDLGLVNKIIDLADEIIYDLEDMSDLRFQANHKQQLCFLLWRYGPDIVYEALVGIRLSTTDYFIKRLRERCAIAYMRMTGEGA